MDFRNTARRLGLDLSEYLEMIALFDETSRADIAKIDVAVSANSRDGMAQSLRSIKGAAGALGFVDVFQTAQGLEVDTESRSLLDLAQGVSELASEILIITVKATRLREDRV
jgi:HPt (histidine-containing phosphotransfer) domain-containing protein